MDYTTEQMEAQQFFDHCMVILMRKTNDYASNADCFSNFKKMSYMCNLPIEKTFLMMMTVKIARIIELLEKPNKNEAMEDSLTDLVNYACLMAVFRKESHNGHSNKS